MCDMWQCENLCRLHAYDAVQRNDLSMHGVVHSNSVHAPKTCFGAIWELSFVYFFFQFRSSTASQNTQGNIYLNYLHSLFDNYLLQRNLQNWLDRNKSTFDLFCIFTLICLKMPTISEIRNSIRRLEQALIDSTEDERNQLVAELVFQQQQLLALLQILRVRIDRENQNLEEVLEIIKRREQ